MKLYAGEGERPFASLDQLVAEFSVVDYLRRKVNITRITVSRPDAWIEIDEQGRSNIDALHMPPESERVEQKIRFLTAGIDLVNGRLTFIDRRQKLESNIENLEAHFIPLDAQALEDRINHRLELAFNNSSATYQGRAIESISSRLLAQVTEGGARVEQLKLDSEAGRLTAIGQVPSYDPLKYSFDLQSTLAVGEIARVFAPDTQAQGTASFNGNIEGTGPDYRLAGEISSDSLSLVGVRINDVNLNTNLRGSGAEIDATARVTAQGLSGDGLSIGSIRLSDADIAANLKGEGAVFDVSGALELSSLKSGEVTVSSLRGTLEADQNRVALSNLSASALGGSLSGSASIAYGGGQSRLDLRFNSISLNQAASLVSPGEVRVRGTASGAATLRFPGLNYEAAIGPIDATFDAAVSPPEPGTESLPATGRVSIVRAAGGYQVSEAFIRTDRSRIDVSGTISQSGRANLGFNLNSSDMSEVFRALDGFGLIPEDLQEQYQISLSGPGIFSGGIQGQLAAPSVTGRLELENIQARGESLGSFEGDIAFSPSRFSIENASLILPDQSRADFTVGGPIPKRGREGEGGGISLDATLDKLNLSTLARLVVPELSDIVSGGVVSGKLDLQGLPGPRGISGTADITVSSAELSVPSAEEGQDVEKISVPQLSSNIYIENSVVRVQNLQAQIGDSAITGDAMFNLDTYAYSIDAKGEDINLARLAEALPENVNLTGQADISITGQGDWDEWSTLDLNATIQGQDVRLNGRELGDAGIAAFTENGLLKVQATASVLDEPRTLTATIDLTDRRNYPITGRVEFTNEDLGQYLGLISPELSGLTARGTGVIELNGPLQDPGQIQAVATLSSLTLGAAVAGEQEYTISNVGDIRITASTEMVTIEPVTFTGEGTNLTLSGTMARENGARSNMSVNGAINLRFINSFTSTFFATGIASVQASVTGSLTSPHLLGVVSLTDVGLRALDFPLVINRGSGQIRFTTDRALIENFTATTSGGGRLALQGGAALDGLVPAQWLIEANADQVGIEYPADVFTVFDADIEYRGNPRIQVLSGDVDVRRASYTKDSTIEELVRTGGPFGSDFLSIGPSGGGAIRGALLRLDLRIEANNTLIVRNNLVDALGSAFLNLDGTIDNPEISGRVLLSRGTVDFRGDRHELRRGVITFPGGRRAEPILDFQTEAEISGYRITTTFSGTLSRLETTLSSDPDLPDPDIISLILTGNLAPAEGRTAAAVAQTGLGLAQSLLGASLSEQIERGAQRIFGLSRFSIDPLIVGRGSDPTARVTFGQQVTRDLTVTYSQNLSTGSSGLDRVVIVEYRLSNRFSIVGFRNERGGLGFDLRFRRRF